MYGLNAWRATRDGLKFRTTFRGRSVRASVLARRRLGQLVVVLAGITERMPVQPAADRTGDAGIAECSQR